MIAEKLTARLQFRLGEDLARRVRATADLQHRELHQQIRYLLEMGLQHEAGLRFQHSFVEARLPAADSARLTPADSVADIRRTPADTASGAAGVRPRPPAAPIAGRNRR